MDGFLHDLAGAKAVIANAGFSLVSEALHLGKPYLAIPVKNQFEQTFNAYYVDKLGYGAWWKDLGKEQIESFLFNLPFYSDNLHSYPRAGNGAILAKVDELDRRRSRQRDAMPENNPQVTGPEETPKPTPLLKRQSWPAWARRCWRSSFLHGSETRCWKAIHSILIRSSASGCTVMPLRA